MAEGHWTTLGGDGAECGGCGRNFGIGGRAWCDRNWLFCGPECAAKWPGQPPAKWRKNA